MQLHQESAANTRCTPRGIHSRPDNELGGAADDEQETDNGNIVEGETSLRLGTSLQSHELGCDAISSLNPKLSEKPRTTGMN